MENNPLDDELLKELGLDTELDENFDNQDEDKKDSSNDEEEGFSFDEEATSPEAKLDSELDQPSSSPKESSGKMLDQRMIDNLDQEVTTNQPFKESSSLVDDMPIQLVAVLAKKTMTLKELIKIKQGEVIAMNKLPNEQVDLVANGKLVAKGQMVLIDGKLGIQIKQIVA